MILAGRDEPVEGVSTGLDTIPVMVSTDGGNNWTNVTDNIPLEKRWISRVVTDPADENTMYIVRCGFSEGNKIHKTTDLGETWTNISGNLPDIPCNTLFIDPEIPNQIYAGTDLGVYLSEDYGDNYYYAGGDMPLVPIQDFDYVKINDTRYLRIATYGRSIYETILPPPQNIEEIGSYKNKSLKIHPNPFAASTTIEYKLQESSGVKLSIYNNLGMEEKILVNENQTAGMHRFTFDGAELEAGIYLVMLQAGVQIETTKLFVMK
jgi:hypothetical protein